MNRVDHPSSIFSRIRWLIDHVSSPSPSKRVLYDGQFFSTTPRYMYKEWICTGVQKSSEQSRRVNFVHWHTLHILPVEQTTCCFDIYGTGSNDSTASIFPTHLKTIIHRPSPIGEGGGYALEPPVTLYGSRLLLMNDNGRCKTSTERSTLEPVLPRSQRKTIHRWPTDDNIHLALENPCCSKA